jgi:hypothetical protein
METPTAVTDITGPQQVGSSAPVWLKRVPMITGVLAGLAGFLTVRSAGMSNQAIYNSNQAVLHQAVASDKWAEFQADSIKRHQNQLALDTLNPNPTVVEKLAAEEKTLREKQDEVEVRAKAEEYLESQELENGHQKLAIKDLLDYAGVAAQLGIALASIAALTRVRPAYYLGIVFGALGMLITAYALAGSYIGHLIWRH